MIKDDKLKKLKKKVSTKKRKRIFGKEKIEFLAYTDLVWYRFLW
jgi:hypothetical protein